MNNKVSIIIPTYNRGETISRAIDSILNQTYKNYEIIICDDNSTDNTFNIVSNYMKDRKNIKYIKHEINKGACAARNTGAKLAEGEFLAFLDSDDEWINTKLEKEVMIFNKKKDISLIYSNIYSVDVISGNEKLYIQDDYEDKYLGLLCKNIIGSTSVIIVRKDEFWEIGGFNISFPSCQDWEFYIRFSEKFKIYKINEPLLKYYIHSNSISGNLSRVIEGHKLIMDIVMGNIRGTCYEKYKNEIISNQYTNMAQIYKSFGMFYESRKYYKKAILKKKSNIKALKNILTMIWGKKIYSLLLKISS